MYDYFQGALAEKNGSYVVVDVHGVGYKLYTPSNLFGHLPQIGERVLLFASWVVREMSHTLYGFLEKGERELFEILITLSGIGPKTALNLISHFSLAQLQAVVAKGDDRALSKVPGIGKKTAERLLVDLKGKLKISTISPSSRSTYVEDALNALMNLGYSEANAEQAVEKALQEVAEGGDLSLLITAALKYKIRS